MQKNGKTIGQNRIHFLNSSIGHQFLDSSLDLYEYVPQSVGWSVGWMVRWLAGKQFFFGLLGATYDLV